MKEYFKKSARHNLQVLGVKKTFEIIEKFKNPIFRAKMRLLHLEALKEMKGGD